MEPAKIFWWWGGQSVLITQVAVSYLTVIAKGLEGVTQIKDDDVIHRLARGINCNLHRVWQVAGQAGGAVHGVPCEPGAADGGGDCVGQGGGDRVDHVSQGGKLVVVIEAVFLTILFSGLVSLNGTGFSPCSEPGAAATLCDGGAACS